MEENSFLVGASEELQSMNDIKNQRLQKLKSKDRETEKALVWLESHQDLFRERVFPPVVVLVGEEEGYVVPCSFAYVFFLAKVSVCNRQFAAHIEHFFMTGRDAFSFIALNTHDYELFLREVCVCVCLCARVCGVCTCV